MGLPVVSSFHADIPEVVWDGESGHLVPERDVESLANALAQLLDAPGKWAEMGRSGREHVLRQHAPKAVGAQLHAVYESILQDQKELRRPVA
jgi:glycosyltransferase involved in cell wall biosynthesis